MGGPNIGGGGIQISPDRSLSLADSTFSLLADMLLLFYQLMFVLVVLWKPYRSKATQFYMPSIAWMR